MPARSLTLVGENAVRPPAASTSSPARSSAARCRARCSATVGAVILGIPPSCLLLAGPTSPLPAASRVCANSAARFDQPPETTGARRPTVAITDGSTDPRGEAAQMTDLTGRTVAFVATDGYEDSELTEPWRAVADAGAQPVMIAPEAGEIEGKKGHRQPVDRVSGEVDAAEFDALVLPGGVINADHLRMDEPAVRFARAFFEAGKPV